MAALPHGFFVLIEAQDCMYWSETLGKEYMFLRFPKQKSRCPRESGNGKII